MCLIVYDLETSTLRRPRPQFAVATQKISGYVEPLYTVYSAGFGAGSSDINFIVSVLITCKMGNYYLYRITYF